MDSMSMKAYAVPSYPAKVAETAGQGTYQPAPQVERERDSTVLENLASRLAGIREALNHLCSRQQNILIRTYGPVPEPAGKEQPSNPTGSLALCDMHLSAINQLLDAAHQSLGAIERIA